MAVPKGVHGEVLDLLADGLRLPDAVLGQDAADISAKPAQVIVHVGERRLRPSGFGVHRPDGDCCVLQSAVIRSGHDGLDNAQD